MPASSFGDKSSVRKVKFPFLLPGGKVTRLGSCNGLVFLVAQINLGEYFYICNPSTGLFKQLPSPGSDEDRLSNIGGGGVGYVSATDDYKVLTAYFEEYEEDEVPNIFQDGMDFGCNGVSHGGCLCVSLYRMGTCDPIDFWVMREYGVRDTWSKLFILKLSNPLENLGYIFLVTESSSFGWTTVGLIRIDHKEEEEEEEEQEKLGLYVVRNPICITDYEESLLWINE